MKQPSSVISSWFCGVGLCLRQCAECTVIPASASTEQAWERGSRSLQDPDHSFPSETAGIRSFTVLSQSKNWVNIQEDFQRSSSVCPGAVEMQNNLKAWFIFLHSHSVRNLFLNTNLLERERELAQSKG